MATDLFEGLETAWEDAGGSAAAAPLAAGIALSESGGNPNAQNTADPSGGSYGLWQINGIHAPGGTATPAWIASIENPETNAAEAVALSGDGTNWGPWTDDATWRQWVAAGSPPDPSEATVESWLGAAGVNTGQTTAALTSDTSGGSTPWWDQILPDLEGLGANVATGGANVGAGIVGSAANAAIGGLASSVESFVAKALLVVAGLAIAVFGIIKTVSPDAKPTEALAAAAPVVAAA